MIFQTFDSNIDSWTTKIGALGTSFHDLGTTISTAFQTAKDASSNPEESAGFMETFKNSLLSSKENSMGYVRNTQEEIITQDNIDTYIPQLNQESAGAKLTEIVETQEKVKNGTNTWDNYFSTLDQGEEYLTDLIQNTDDLSKLTKNDLVKANEKARASVLSQNEALKAQTLSAKASKIAFQALSSIGNMAAGFLISKGIEVAVTAIDNLIHRQERLAEAAKTAGENIQNSYSSFSDTKQSTNSITPEFAELSQHVNQTTGENIDLSTEEYERFLELSNQLAEIFPTIGYTVDESGNKIIGLSGSVDEITQSINDLVQAQQLLTHQEISNNMDDVFQKTREDIAEYEHELTNLKHQKVDIPDVRENIQALLDGKELDFQINSQDNSQLFSTMQDMFQNLGLKLNLQEGKMSLNQDAEEAELSDKEIEQLMADADIITGNYAAYNEAVDKQIADVQNKIQMSVDSFAPNLTSWLTTDQNYSNIVQTYGGNLGSAIQKSVQSIDLTDQDIEKWGGMEAWITDNILAPLNNADNEEIRQAYIELFTNADIPLDSAMDYLTQIEKYYKDNDLEIPIVFTDQKDELTDLQKKFDKKNASFQTGNTAELESFFQENSIDEADEYEKWLSVTDGITDATTAMEAWKRAMAEQEPESPLSFQEAWDSIGTTGTDSAKESAQAAKDQLLQLAETGKLTAEELENSSAGQTLMDQAKLSAEEATQQINSLVDSSKQLSSLKAGISPISSVLVQKQDNLNHDETAETGISADTLSGFDANIKGLNSWKEFEETLGNGKSSMDECQQAANKLASEWVNSNNFLSQLNDTNEEYYISQLQEMGIENARSIVKQALNQQVSQEDQEKINLAISTVNLADGIQNNELAALSGETEWLNTASTATQQYYLQKLLANKNALSTSESTANLISLAKQAGLTGKAIDELNTLLSMQNTYETMKQNGASTEELNAYSNKIKKQKKKVNKAANKKTTTNVALQTKQNTDTSTTNTRNTDTTPQPKQTKQSFDWLDRYVTVLSQKIDLLKAKLENLFSVKAKNRNLSKQIKAVNKEIKAYSKEAKVYSKKAKTIIPSSKLRKKIDNGQFKGKKYGQLVEEYGEEKAKKIQKYMDLKDKASSAKQNWQEAKKTKRDLKIQQKQNWVDHHDALNSKYDAQIENAATAKKKNTLEKKKITATKKSYNYQIKIANLEKNSVKAATLLAQKWQEIAKIRKQILQNQLDENATKREYNNVAYENKNLAEKKKLIQDNIASYEDDNNAHAENVKSAQNTVNSAKNKVTKTSKAATTQLKKSSMNSKVIKEIKSYLKNGKKVPDKYLKMAEKSDSKLYKKLVAYNNAIDAEKISVDALNTAKNDQKQSNEENQTAIREERSKSIQLDIDAANNTKDRLSSEYGNLSSVDEKNKNIDAQLQQQATIHNKTLEQLKNDIVDPAELADAIAKEEADWISTQREQEVLKLQNLSEEQSAQYALKQQLESNADSAKEKNKYEAESREHLKSQYNYEIQIAEKNGDLVEAKRLRLEQEQKIEESYQKQIENIKAEYDLIIGINNARKSTIDSQIAALQANGYGISIELYSNQQKLDQESYHQTLAEIASVSKEMQNLSGDALKQAEIELESLKQQAWDYQKAWAEIQQMINDINLAKIERIGTMLKYQSDNLEYIQDILSNSDFTLSDQEIGGLTQEGLANAAVTFAQISNNNEQIANLYDQIAEKQNQLNSGKYVGTGDQITEEINELISKAHELEKANYDSGKSIKSLVMDSLNSLSDALDNSISKYKDALNAQKDLYDYRKKVADQLKSIATLEKQLAALQGSDSEEARAKIQKLQIQLKDEQQNLKDTEYDKYIQDQEEMLDKVSEDFQSFIASVANMSVSEICTAVHEVVEDNLDTISCTIADAFAESTKIGQVATSIDGLTTIIKNLEFSGNVDTKTDENGNLDYKYTDNKGNQTNLTVDNQKNPGSVTSVTENGNTKNIPDKEVSKTEAKTNNATSPQQNTTHPKQKIAGEIYEKEQKMKNAVSYLINYAASYISGGSSRMSVDRVNQYIYPRYKKMLDLDEENVLLRELNIDGSSNDYAALGRAAEKIQSLGFSQGGIVSSLNKIALANGDDGWATLQRGESVLTPAQTEQFRKLTDNLVPLNTIAETIASLPDTPIPTSHLPVSNTTVRNIDIHLDGSNVIDADSFIHTLHNPRVLQEVSNGISSQLGSVMSNRLGNF